MLIENDPYKGGANVLFPYEPTGDADSDQFENLSGNHKDHIDI